MAKAISLDNLAQFKANCDQTYAKVGEGGITLSTVIERPEELPTATADSPDFVEVGGVLYRKKAVEGGNLLGTWSFTNDVANGLVIGVTAQTFKVNFTSNNVQYTSITIDNTGAPFDPNASLKYGNTVVFTNNNWNNTSYKTIQITDISALTNEAEFTTWLTANATKQGGGGGTVTYSYVALKDA